MSQHEVMVPCWPMVSMTTLSHRYQEHRLQASVSAEVYLLGWDGKRMVTFSSSFLPCWAVANSNLTRRGERTPPHLKAGDQAKRCPRQAPRRFRPTERKNRINPNYGLRVEDKGERKGTGELRCNLAPSQPHPFTGCSPNTTSCLGTSRFIDSVPSVGGTTPASEIPSLPRVPFHSTCAVLCEPVCVFPSLSS